MSKYHDPFPSIGHYVLRYSDIITLNPAAGGSAVHVWRANSIYDPDVSLAGHQPYGRDTLLSIYNHYVVDKAVITMVPTQFGNTVATYGIRVDDDDAIAIIQDFNQFREVTGTSMAITAVGAQPTPVSRTYDRKKMWPIERDTSALQGTNPAEGVFFHTWMQGPNAATDPGSVSFIINITYYCTMFELRDLPAS
jgi:hypothetical protein